MWLRAPELETYACPEKAEVLKAAEVVAESVAALGGGAKEDRDRVVVWVHRQAGDCCSARSGALVFDPERGKRFRTEAIPRERRRSGLRPPTVHGSEFLYRSEKSFNAPRLPLGVLA